MTPKELVALAIKYVAEWGIQLAASCPEIGQVPTGWAFVSDSDNRQIYWVNLKTGDATSTHPHYGPLPRDWVLRVYSIDGGGYKARYLNIVTGEVKQQDPRFSSAHLRQQSQEISKDLRISATTTRNVGLDLKKMQHQPIEKSNVRDRYEIVHTIDAGDGKLGGMNGGVHVVRLKDVPSKLYVEKRFPKKLIPHAQEEIAMIHRLKHSALTMYTAAFTTSSTASIYLEFCDRGSLTDMLKEYSKHPGGIIPEPFIWHAFIGLADGLAYLQTGGEGSTNWFPIIHGDLKPDNILLRSRSTHGSTKYPYCILSDFGLAFEQTHFSRSDSSKIGSKMWWAPELLYDPYPKKSKSNQMSKYPNGRTHTKRTDVWSLGVIMFNLTSTTDFIAKPFMPLGHLIWPIPHEYKKLTAEVFFQGAVSRKKNLKVSDDYTKCLDQALRLALAKEVGQRPDGKELLKMLKGLNHKSGFWSMESAIDHPLPDWSIKVHTYHM